MNDISALMKGAPVSSLNLFLPSGDAKSKQESATLRRVIIKSSPMVAPISQTFSIQNCEK